MWGLMVFALCLLFGEFTVVNGIVAIVATVCITLSTTTSIRSRRSSSGTRSRIPITGNTIDGDALYSITSNNIPRAAHEACDYLNLYATLGFTAEELSRDMQLVEGSYLDNLYHTRHHGADVVSKSARTLQRDGKHLRRLIRRAQGLNTWSPDCKRRYAVFELAVILAAAQHDSLHPGFNNAYLKAINHAMALEHGTAEQASVAYFKDIYMSQQRVLNCLSEDERQLVQQIVTYSIAQTDTQVHASALEWKAQGEVPIMQHLAAIIVHAADLGNGADSWPVSKVWAQWCNSEFHAQGDHSRRYHPELPLTAQFNRYRADVPNGQLFFLETFATPTFKVLKHVAPTTAAAGLQGCKANAAKCRAIIENNERSVKQRVAYAFGMGKVPRFL